MNISDLDLNLLTVFDAVYTERSITRAADNLGMSQPAVSNALGRLREAVGDPLFIRVGRGVAPTARAQQLAGPLRRALDTIQHTLSEQWLFDYASAEHHFRIAMSDYGDAVILPKLLDWLSRAAPGVSLSVIPVSELDLPGEMRAGHVDLAVGNLEFLEAHSRTERLLEESFVTVVRADHPQIRDNLTLRQYASTPQVHVMHPSRGSPLVDRELAAHGLERRIAVRVSSFMAVPVIVAESDLIATLPLRLARSFAGIMGLRLLDPPVSLGSVSINQYWHPRTDRDPANQWLREAVRIIGERIA
ncbi:LysR family transcriptional regulator [Ectothiorhodospiraceae bacterium WFHF3C12]|nr:LysR family transcriptional regulator [Ectothiorhodospiraceae bacterium WFHF3C12]